MNLLIRATYMYNLNIHTHNLLKSLEKKVSISVTFVRNI